MNSEEVQERKAQITQLTEKLVAAADGAPHKLLIEALINAFVIVSEKHRCCTGKSAYRAILAAEHLFSLSSKNAAETENRPQGAPLH
jgi:hypothetical protein